MDSNDKRRFIEDLTANTKEELIQKISQMPEEWNGFELRWLLAEKFEESAPDIKANRRRYRKYRNEVLVRNL